VAARSSAFPSIDIIHIVVLQPPPRVATRWVWALPRSLATTGGIIVYFLFLEVLRCFSSLRLPSVIRRSTGLVPGGLSHSDIRGSRDTCSYPRLFAAYRVLHRLCEPRHPPCALIYFLVVFFDAPSSIPYNGKDAARRSYFQLYCL
jgi:hypothetical protein